MAKAPRAGTVKTRLTHLGANVAAELAACFAMDVIATTMQLAPIVIIAYAPSDGRIDFEPLIPPYGAGRIVWHPQVGANLGDRIDAAIRFAVERGAEQILVVGTDSPTVPVFALEDAFASLASSDIVLGPAEDGGYWCVGMHRSIPGLFDEVDWSTATVFEQTVANAARLGLSIATVASWYDIDTPADLERLEQDPNLAERAPATAIWFSERAAHRRTTA